MIRLNSFLSTTSPMINPSLMKLQLNSKKDPSLVLKKERTVKRDCARKKEGEVVIASILRARFMNPREPAHGGWRNGEWS